MIRRVVAVTLNYDHPQRGMLAALHALFGTGHVYHYDYLQRVRDGVDAINVNAEIIQAVRDFRPDWIWFQLQNTGIVLAETLREARATIPTCVISHWTGDIRPTVDPYLASICAASHLTFAASVGQLDLFRDAGAPEAVYLPHGLDWEEDVLGEPPWTPPFRVPDVVFCGNHYGGSLPGTAEREGAIRALAVAGVDVGVVGNGWDYTGLPVAGRCAVKQQHHVWRRSKVALSVNHFPGLPGYHGDRQIVAMASGTPVVARHFPLMEKEFNVGASVLSYRDESELVALVEHLLGDPELRAMIGAAGRAEVVQRHSWFSRMVEAFSRADIVSSRLRSEVA